MVLQSSGAISLNDIQTEFGGTNPIGINEYYGVASGIPSSGLISFNQFYGASSGIEMLLSKELIYNQGYNNYTLNVTKDMSYAGARSIPAHSNPTNGSWAITPSGVATTTRWRWNDWGDDFFDDWGDFYIYNPATGTAVYIHFIGGFINNGDGAVWSQTQTVFGKQFRVRHGWAAQGIYKLDVECTDRSFAFCLGCYGNMGADGEMVNEDRQYTVPWGKLNYNYNWQNTGTAPYREHFFTHFVPKLKSFNDSITANYSSNNFGSHLTTVPAIYNNTHGDNLAIYTSSLTIGGTFYFVKGGNSTTGAMYEWVANDIASVSCLYNFISHTFTSCGASGRTGPTITQVRTAYGPSGGVGTGMGYGASTPLQTGEYNYLSLWYAGDWNFLTMTTQGIQLWTVPATGEYEFELSGAKGGAVSGVGSGGLGGYVKGTKTFNSGTVLALIVGQKGEDSTVNSAAAAGGGGASWVLSADLSVVYAVAGGGGGCNGTYAGAGAYGGNGATIANTADSGGGAQGNYGNGGGAGYGGNGSGGYSGTANPMGGQSPANGALGGSALTQHNTSPNYQQDGGFGGGGACGWHAGGGGAGYAGGDGVGYTTVPGGLGGTTYGAGMNSPIYNTATNSYSYSSTDHGLIKITRLWTLYSFSSFTFTNAGATGRTGPTLTQLRNTYSASWTDDTNYLDVTSTGIQLWTVPKTGSYRIEAWGAAGGETHSSRGQKGNGARMRGDFSLTKGEIIRILVGQQPPNGGVGSGGGGGSFVVKSPYNTNASILVIAGGGGCWYWDAGSGGTTSTTGQNSLTSGGSPDYAMSGGSNGNGGDGSSNGPTGSQGGAGGGGFFTAGGNLRFYSAISGTGGHSFTSGGLGGSRSSASQGSYYGDGGFGGGGASGYGAGGGGGYSGGGGDWSNGQGWDLNSGGGGGSYNNGSNQNHSGNVQYGHGQVTITAI